jgi:Amt family ammonium transporter
MPITRQLFGLSLVLLPCTSLASSEIASRESIDVIWLATAAALVFFMQAGFALLESGFSRAKNSVNVIMKNYTDVCVGTIFFWVVGYGLMFGVNQTGWYGASHFALNEGESWDYSFLLFQTMFAATAATIASGAMAERTRYRGYLIGTIGVTAVIYPLFGSWAWGSFYSGKGWLADMGFIDFAGSSVVHSVGGWTALAAIIVLGPRLGRFDTRGKPREVTGHNLNFVALGGFILWFGWFGFNGGSTVSADVNIGLINLNTQLAAAVGAVVVVLVARLSNKPIYVSTVVNGSLAGLVGITAGCASMDPIWAMVTGGLSALVAYFAEKILLSIRIDDVVGAVAVHAFGGATGTICAGLFLKGDMFNVNVVAVQVLGVLACLVWTFTCAFIMYKLIDVIWGLRASALHEQRGLDFTEHDEVAYPEFFRDTFYTKANLSDVERE